MKTIVKCSDEFFEDLNSEFPNIFEKHNTKSNDSAHIVFRKPKTYNIPDISMGSSMQIYSNTMASMNPIFRQKIIAKVRVLGVKVFKFITDDLLEKDSSDFKFFKYNVLNNIVEVDKSECQNNFLPSDILEITSFSKSDIYFCKENVSEEIQQCEGLYSSYDTSKVYNSNIIFFRNLSDDVKGKFTRILTQIFPEGSTAFNIKYFERDGDLFLIDIDTTLFESLNIKDSIGDDVFKNFIEGLTSIITIVDEQDGV